MLRHDFQPGKLTAGLFLAVTGVIYLGDAGDAWDTPWFVALPLVIAGLCLAGVVASLNHAIRGRQASRWTDGQGRRDAGSTGKAGGAGGPGTAADAPGRNAEHIRPPDGGLRS